VQSFTARMPLLTATSASGLGMPLTVRDSSVVTDSNTVLYDAKEISVYSSLRDIITAPPRQPRL